ncbi:MAG: calcium/sodium antiporter [Candidatus Moranbacteria bacterium]|nr:calcium/sodium antiporter [Candidatus Moranbacteria bacterium]
MLLNIIIVLISFGILIKGADYFVKGAASIAVKLGMSAFVVGLTIVAIGTSAPELFVNVSAVLKGSTELSIGNILGSNVINILLGLGISAIIVPLSIEKRTVWKEIPFSLLAAIMIFIFGSDRFIEGVGENVITRIDGLALLGFFILFIVYTFGLASVEKSGENGDEIENISLVKSIFYTIGGIFALVLGGNFVVSAATEIAVSLNISENLIGLTIVAIGTSLPEIVMSAIGARKGHVDLVVGGIVGSCIFNALFALGVTATVGDLAFTGDNIIDALFLVLVSVILFVFMFIGKKKVLEKSQGIFFVLLYVAYILFAVLRG